MKPQSNQLKILCVCAIFILYPTSIGKENQDSVKELEEITYNINGKTYKTKTPSLEYKTKIYLSIEDIATLFNKKYDVDENSINFVDRVMDEDETQNLKLTYYNNVYIESIDYESQILSIKFEDKNSKKQICNMIITDKTKIKCPNSENVFPTELLKQGMCVTLIIEENNNQEEYPFINTIILKEEQNYVDTINLKRGKIIKINKEQQCLHIECEGQGKLVEEIIVHIDANTDIRMKDTHQSIEVDALKIGMSIEVETNNVFTQSIPKHTIGLKIKILS